MSKTETHNQSIFPPSARLEWFVLFIAVGGTLAATTLRTFWMPWFWSSEETPYAQEALRFLTGNFHQQFFDIPGTPLILLGAGFLRTLVGLDGPFFHLDLLLEIFRAISGVSFVIACACIFSINQRFASRWAALFGTLVIVVHPIVAQTLHHLRIEPFALCIVSLSILAWLRAIETKRWVFFLGAAFLAGVSMAARFQLLLAVLPVFIVHALIHPVVYNRTRWIDAALLAAFASTAVFGGSIAVLFRAGYLGGPLTDIFGMTAEGNATPFPHASPLIAKLWITCALAVIGVSALALLGWGRKRLSMYSQSSLLTMLAWFPAGLLIGAPTLLVSGRYFLSSVEMFLARNAYVPEYQNTAMKVIWIYLIGKNGPGELLSWSNTGEVGILFTLPLAIIFGFAFFGRARHSLLFWLSALGCVIGVLSQFGKIQGSRHIFGWLPWFSIVIAVGADCLARQIPPVRARALICGVCALGIVGSVAARAQAYVSSDLAVLSSRLRPLKEMSDWIRAELPEDAPVFFTCCSAFTEDAVLGVMAGYGVRPPWELTSAAPWFGSLSTLRDAGDGFLVITRNEYEWAYVDYFSNVDPSNVLRPWSDPHFHLLKSFPIGDTRESFQIFSFNFSGEARRMSGGISIVSATYGANCKAAIEGNATAFVRRYCNRKDSCNFAVRVGALGDPAPLCAKDFSVTWTCSGETRHESIPAEANDHTVTVSCP